MCGDKVFIVSLPQVENVGGGECRGWGGGGEGLGMSNWLGEGDNVRGVRGGEGNLYEKGALLAEIDNGKV